MESYYRSYIELWRAMKCYYKSYIELWRAMNAITRAIEFLIEQEVAPAYTICSMILGLLK